MKGQLVKFDDVWMVKYTTYKTIPGVKGVIGSHSRLPESNYLKVHPDYLSYIMGVEDEWTTVDFEIVVHNFVEVARFVNEDKFKRPTKRKKISKVIYQEEDVIKLMGMATRWDTFKEGDPEYSMDMDDFINNLITKYNDKQ